MTTDHDGCPVESEGSFCLQSLVLQTALTGVLGIEKKSPSKTGMPYAKRFKKTLPGGAPRESENPSLAPAVAGLDPQGFAGEAGGT